ncbi:MAG: hypothetical protein KIS76_18105 [Pyrinomonadaceae bacterium]|nr:hypothetical protein [Pyrinomonadaceae bacterium]
MMISKEDRDDLKFAFPFLMSAVPAFLGFILAMLLLGEDCSLFGNPEGFQMCHTIPNDCCIDMMSVTFAQISFFLGFGVSGALMFLRWKKVSGSDSEISLFSSKFDG